MDTKFTSFEEFNRMRKEKGYSMEVRQSWPFAKNAPTFWSWKFYKQTSPWWDEFQLLELRRPEEQPVTALVRFSAAHEDDCQIFFGINDDLAIFRLLCGEARA